MFSNEANCTATDWGYRWDGPEMWGVDWPGIRGMAMVFLWLLYHRIRFVYGRIARVNNEQNGQ